LFPVLPCSPIPYSFSVFFTLELSPFYTRGVPNLDRLFKVLIAGVLNEYLRQSATGVEQHRVLEWDPWPEQWTANRFVLSGLSIYSRDGPVGMRFPLRERPQRTGGRATQVT
jgi:hypothetical protein